MTRADRWTVEQSGMAGLVAVELTSAGIGWLSVAATTNAWAASALDPDASGGLFGLGDGDAWSSTRRVVELCYTDGRTVLAARGMDNSELSAVFAEWVLRLSDLACTARADLVVDLFGAHLARRVP